LKDVLISILSPREKRFALYLDVSLWGRQPFSRGEKVRMRVFSQFAKNWTVTEIGTRELGVTSLHALQ
jgi:hypothetical protein